MSSTISISLFCLILKVQFLNILQLPIIIFIINVVVIEHFVNEISVFIYFILLFNLKLLISVTIIIMKISNFSFLNGIDL